MSNLVLALSTDRELAREYWSCLRKLKYTLKAANSVVSKNPERGLRAYRCRYAAHWHITHAPRPPESQFCEPEEP